jgi:hypothetical protein
LTGRQAANNWEMTRAQRLAVGCGLLLLVAAPAAQAKHGPSGDAGLSRRLPARADVQAAAGVAARFAGAAITRRNLSLAYPLAGTEIRGSDSLRQWLRGDIAVPPDLGAAAIASAALLALAPGHVWLRLVLVDAHGRGATPYRLELARRGGRWLVVYCWTEAAGGGPATRMPTI